jgi:hypothetical protein
VILATVVTPTLVLGVRAEPATFRIATLADAPVCIASGICATRSHRPDPVAASTATVERDVAQDNSLTNGSATS